MSQKLVLLVVLLLVAPMILAACGGDDDQGKFGESYKSSSGISFKYPKGWTVSDNGSMIQLSNQKVDENATEAPEGLVGLVIFYPESSAEQWGTTPTARAQVEQYVRFMASEGEFGEVTDVKAGKKTAARVASTGGEDNDMVMFAVEVGGDDVIMAAGIAGKGDLAGNKNTLLDIMGTISYTAPAG